jgi:hypothetical protein
MKPNFILERSPGQTEVRAYSISLSDMIKHRGFAGGVARAAASNKPCRASERLVEGA